MRVAWTHVREDPYTPLRSGERICRSTRTRDATPNKTIRTPITIHASNGISPDPAPAMYAYGATKDKRAIAAQICVPPQFLERASLTTRSCPYAYGHAVPTSITRKAQGLIPYSPRPGRWAMFEAEMADQTVERFEISNSLAAAIENDELMVYFQPILDLGSGRTAGVEALVRWNHPVRGMVNPGSFIPLAERNGLIIPLGRSVLEKAVTQVAQWRRQGHDIYASVNISPVQLQRDGIVGEILEIVDQAGLERDAVVLELTESALINDFDLVVARIDALRAAGLRVAIDDFGTGYATLKYADEFSADILKIDQSFVARLENQDDSTIVSTVLAIAQAMGAETVAEGIEVPDQHRRLLSLGCRLGQGYYFARPAPAEVIGELLGRELEGEALTGHAH